MDASHDAPAARRSSRLKRLIPLALLAAATAVVLTFHLDRYLTLDALAHNRAVLAGFVGAHPLAAPAVFVAVYALAVALSLPGATVLTVAGGFLFGLGPGTLAVVLAATVGATAIFLAARSALGEPLKARAGPWLARLEAGFRDNALSYLLVLRLVPLFPFFVVNLVPAFLGVGLRTYVLATLVGIVPGSFVYASVGAGLDSMIAGAGGGTITLADALTPEVIAALLGLSVLALVPAVYRRLRRRR